MFFAAAFAPSLRSGNLGSPNMGFATLKSSAGRVTCCPSSTQWRMLAQVLSPNISCSHAKQRTEHHNRSVCIRLRPWSRAQQTHSEHFHCQGPTPELTEAFTWCFFQTWYNNSLFQSINSKFLHLYWSQAAAVQNTSITHPPAPLDSHLHYHQYFSVSEHFHCSDYLGFIFVVSLWGKEGQSRFWSGGSSICKYQSL